MPNRNLLNPYRAEFDDSHLNLKEANTQEMKRYHAF